MMSVRGKSWESSRVGKKRETNDVGCVWVMRWRRLERRSHEETSSPQPCSSTPVFQEVSEKETEDKIESESWVHWLVGRKKNISVFYGLTGKAIMFLFWRLLINIYDSFSIFFFLNRHSTLYIVHSTSFHSHSPFSCLWVARRQTIDDTRWDFFLYDLPSVLYSRRGPFGYPSAFSVCLFTRASDSRQSLVWSMGRLINDFWEDSFRELRKKKRKINLDTLDIYPCLFLKSRQSSGVNEKREKEEAFILLSTSWVKVRGKLRKLWLKYRSLGVIFMLVSRWWGFPRRKSTSSRETFRGQECESEGGDKRVSVTLVPSISQWSQNETSLLLAVLTNDTPS